MSDSHLTAFDKASKAGFIITLGIVYGDNWNKPPLYDAVSS
ncbi:Kup system potassium uptake protein [Streptococcus pyogenes]|nr:Kup system potassium uptake protein [Streptococcus pyogenes]